MAGHGGVHGMSLRFYLIMAIFQSCKAISFSIERAMNMPDIFPNDIGISSDGNRWVKIPCRQSCTQFNAHSPVGGCRCRCKHPFSTFQMMGTAKGSACMPNFKFRVSSHCTIQLRGEGNLDDKLSVLDISSSSVQYINPPGGVTQPRCSLNGKPSIWDQGNWIHIVESDLFNFTSPNFWTNKLTWKSSSKYVGRIMRVPVRCQGSQSYQESCVVFKIKGTLTYDFSYPPPTTPASTPTTSRTARTTTTPTTVTTPTTPKTARIPTTPRTARTTTAPRTVTTPTPKTATTPTTPRTVTTPTTPRTVTTPTTPKTATTPSTPRTTATTTITTVSSAPSTSAPTTATTLPSIPPTGPATTHEPDDRTTTEHIHPPDTDKTTKEPTTSSGGVPGKDARDGSKDDSNTITIAAIAAAAAIACVAIVSVLVYYIIRQKRRHGNDEAYSADMTVIMNSTGQNNNYPSGGKHPVYDDAVYCEPSEQKSTFHKRKLPGLGNPVYDNALVKPASSRHFKNINLERRGSNNIYDNREYEHANNGKDNCYDNTAYDVYDDIDEMKQKPGEELYEALPEDTGGDNIYQPLVREDQVTSDGPSYVTLINEGEPHTPQLPEYLTIVPDNQAQPTHEDSLTYDYANPTSTINRLPKDPEGPDTDGAASQGGPPLYEVLEKQEKDLHEQAAPGSSEQPVYVVLEGPEAEEGPNVPIEEDLSVYRPGAASDVKKQSALDEASEPPVYDVLEDPDTDVKKQSALDSASEPPVYDVLEDPDTNYLMPVA